MMVIPPYPCKADKSLPWIKVVGPHFIGIVVVNNDEMISDSAPILGAYRNKPLDRLIRENKWHFQFTLLSQDEKNCLVIRPMLVDKVCQLSKQLCLSCNATP